MVIIFIFDEYILKDRNNIQLLTFHEVNTRSIVYFDFQWKKICLNDLSLMITMKYPSE